jgi:hypothetical protein
MSHPSRFLYGFDGLFPALVFEQRFVEPAWCPALAVLVYAAGGLEVYAPLIDSAVSEDVELF